MPIINSTIVVDASDNGKTYALGAVSSAQMDTVLTDGFKIRFVKTAYTNETSTISSTLGFRGLDHSPLPQTGPITLLETGDSVEFMFDAANACWQVVAMRLSGTEQRIEAVANRVTATEGEIDTLQTDITALKSVTTIPAEYKAAPITPGGRVTFDLTESKSFVVTLSTVNITNVRVTNSVKAKANEFRVLFVNGTSARTVTSARTLRCNVHRQKGTTEIASLAANDVLLIDFTSSDGVNWYPRKVAEWNPTALLDTTSVTGAPVIKSITYSVDENSRYVNSIKMPASVNNGDLLVLTIGVGGAPFTTAPAPTGWTRATPDHYDGGGGLLQFYKIGASSDAGKTIWYNTGGETTTVSYVHCIQSGTYKSLRTGALLPVFTRSVSNSISNITWASSYGAGPHQLLAFGYAQAGYLNGGPHVVSHALAQNQDAHWPDEENAWISNGVMLANSSLPVTGETHTVAPYVINDNGGNGWTTRLLAVPGVNATNPSQPQLIFHREYFVSSSTTTYNVYLNNDPTAPIQAGDLMLMNYSLRSNSLTAIPAGWTRIGSSSTFHNWFYKIAVANEPSTVQFTNTWSNSNGRVNLYVFAAGSFDAAVAPIVAQATGSSGVIAAPTAVAPSVGRHFVIASESHNMSFSWSPVPTAYPFSSNSPARYHTGFYYSLQNNTGINYGQAWALLTGSTTITPGNFTINGSYTWDASTVIVKSN